MEQALEAVRDSQVTTATLLPLTQNDTSETQLITFLIGEAPLFQAQPGLGNASQVSPEKIKSQVREALLQTIRLQVVLDLQPIS